MANTLNLGNGNWGVKKDSLLGYNSENGNYKPLPFDFTRASSATVVNKAGLIETVGSGEPRIDFSNDAKGALLLEPSRSNLVTYSEDFSDAYWSKSGSSVTSGFASPSGDLSAFKLVEDTSTGEHIIYKVSIGYTLGATLSYSFFAKKGERNVIQTFNYVGGGYHNGADFDLLTGIVSNEVSGSGTMLELDNGWYRCEFTSLATVGQSSTNIAFRTLNASGQNNYTGDGTSGIYIYAAQLEQGSYATSYIPTSGSAVTRSADSCSQTVSSGIIGQTEGTVLLDTKMALQSINNYQLFSINNVGGSDRIRILTATGNRLRFIYQLGGGSLAYSFYDPTDYGSLTSLKIAFTYKSGDIKVYINGVLVDSSSNTFTIAETLTNIDIASSAGGYSQMFFNDVKLYNTALTDAELQALTT